MADWHSTCGLNSDRDLCGFISLLLSVGMERRKQLKRFLSYGVVAVTAFAIGSFSQSRAQPGSQSFSDVPPGSWAYGPVTQVTKAGLMAGYPDGSFGAKRPVTRAELALTLSKLIDYSDSRYAKRPAD